MVKGPFGRVRSTSAQRPYGEVSIKGNAAFWERIFDYAIGLILGPFDNYKARENNLDSSVEQPRPKTKVFSTQNDFPENDEFILFENDLPLERQQVQNTAQQIYSILDFFPKILQPGRGKIPNNQIVFFENNLPVDTLGQLPRFDGKFSILNLFPDILKLINPEKTVNHQLAPALELDEIPKQSEEPEEYLTNNDKNTVLYDDTENDSEVNDDEESGSELNDVEENDETEAANAT
ncbi:uncharacterized protein LOC117566734 [Drosophila albomicans]|uniref:Uncharacterized protein LOC117566734 n=1 Tax=Drosophila albomicans TaxID=7291 RepID=A0A9C6T4Y4_DROAB|nr:uncharacterized protein LOC117566734 [Drosophila albomicans]